MNGQGFQLPVYIVKSVYTSGHVADMAPLQLGIFDAKTYNVATGSGNGKEFFLAGGSPHTKDNISKFYKGMQDRKESAPFYGKDIEKFEKIFPTRARNEQWVIGWDGSSTSNTLKFYGNTTYKLKIRLFGEPIYALFNKSLEKIIPLYTGCVDDNDCSTGCVADPLGVKTQTKAWVKAINDNVELKEFGVKAVPIFSDYSATSASTHDYTLTISDDGSAEALQDVQRSYPTKTITRKSYSRGVSVYEMKAQASSPASFTSKAYSVYVSDCGACSTGTFTPAKDVYYVTRPISGSTDLDDGTARQTFADAVGTDYESQTNATIPTTDVNTTTNVITETAHGYVTGQKLTYDDGGSTAITGLTDNTDYYVIYVSANTFKLATSYANALAGTTIDISGTGNNAQTLTPVITATFLSKNSDGSGANVRLTIEAGSADLSPYLSDTVIKGDRIPAQCTTPSGTTTAWVEGAGNYVVTRTLKITICERDCATASSVTLAQIQNHLSSLQNAVVVTDITGNDDPCCKVFQAVQDSFPMTDEYCMSPDNAIFEDLPSFKDGIWGEVTTTEDYDADIKAGIRISVPFISKTFGDCSYDINERWDAEPIRMELSLYDEAFNPCDFSTVAHARRVVAPKWQKLSAAYVRHEYIVRNQHYFPYETWSTDPRDRDIIDNTALDQIKKNTYFVEYRLQYKDARDSHNFNQKQEHYAPRMFVEEGDLATQVALEAAIGAIASKWDVQLETVGASS